MYSFLGHGHSGSSDVGLPEVFLSACPDGWQLCGEGVFTWSVFRFYRARLLTRSGMFFPQEPFLLDLHYLRSLSAAQIVSTTLDEMVRLSGTDLARQSKWAEQMLNMFPDVTLGDQLLGWFVPGVGVTFFSAAVELGQIKDPEFVNQFSAIWLDERTRSPSLRQALLGQGMPSAPLADVKKASGSEERLA